MCTVDAARFRDADKYASYLNSVAGRMRSELAWGNLRGFLPVECSGLRVVDLGGGTGVASVRLAEMGFDVVLLDGSEEMLRIARKNAEASDAADRISLRNADVGQLDGLFDEEFFDVVVCHNLLEYVEDPAAILRSVARKVRKGGVVSVLARNRYGEVLKAAIKSDNWEIAKANLSAGTVVDSLFGERVRVFDPRDLGQMLNQAGLDVAAEHGVRVFSDYLNSLDLDGAEYQQVLDLEFTLGAQPQFAGIARYTQLIARRSGAPASDGK